MKIFINHLIVPEEVQNALGLSKFAINESASYRLKFQVGEFHCYTTLTKLNKQLNKICIQINEEIEIDVHEHKYITVSLIAIKDRLHSQSPILN